MESLVIQGLLNPDREFWQGRRVLVTGHTGFKGAWLAIWLESLGARVTGISLPPQTSPSLFDLAQLASRMESHFLDIRDHGGLRERLASSQPEIVFHLAAQALVRRGYRQPQETFAVNVQGTVNLLDAVRTSGSVRTVVAVTTDKVYRNLETPLPYRETDTLGGHDPYSASKAAAEAAIACYRSSFLAEAGIAVASARAGNVIGGGDWSEDRLIPDAVRAWSSGQALTIRRPGAVRPWQHVLEPLLGYIRLAECAWKDPNLADAYNFGPNTHEAATVRSIVTLARRAYGKGDVVWGDGSEGPHEAGWLALEVAKARQDLGVVPRWTVAESVERTLRWYRDGSEGLAAADLCFRDIAEFEARAQLGTAP